MFDPDPEARARFGARLFAAAGTGAGRLRVTPLISDCVRDALWIGDHAPERLAFKRKLYQQVQAHCRPEAVIAAVGSSFAASDLQSCATRPDQILAVEIGGGGQAQTPADAIVLPGRHSTVGRLEAAVSILESLGLSARIAPAAAPDPA